MPDLYLIFNHRMTGMQTEDARRSLGIGRFVDLPRSLKELWCSIPPELPEISGYIEPVRQWLASNAEQNDLVLIQGDFGACYLMVRFAFRQGLIPVYSTTSRKAVEEHLAGGAVKITHRFEHRMFRKYGR